MATQMKGYKLMIMAAAALLLAACSGKNDPDRGKNPSGEVSYDVCMRPVYFSPSVGQSDLIDALRMVFPHQTPISSAQIAFVGPEVEGSEFLDFYNKGGFVMVCGVNDATESRLASLIPDMPYLPRYDNEPEKEGVDNLMIYGFNNNLDEFWMPWPYRPESMSIQGEETTDTGSEKSVEGDPDDPKHTVESAAPALPSYDKDMFLGHLDALVDWANRSAVLLDVQDLLVKGGTEDDELNLNLLGQRHHFVYPIAINGYIDKATWSDPDWLCKESEIVGDLEITPLYASSASASSDAGDYYIVSLEVTVKSGDMWGPEQHSHGACNNRIVGFYLERLNLCARLTDQNGGTFADVRFMPSGNPLPGSNVGSSTQTESSTKGFTLGVTGGYKWGQGAGANLNGSASFSASWTSSISRSLKDLQVVLKTPNNNVDYELVVNNILNEHSWDNVGPDIAAHYPEICRSDMTFKSAWVWFLPASTNSAKGVGDGSRSKFRMNLQMMPIYGVFSWWRGAAWDRELHFFPNVDGVRALNDESVIAGGLFIGDIDLPVPNRTRFGYIELTNMSTQYTLTGVRIRKDGEKDFQDMPGAANQNQSIRLTVPAGKYEMEYSFIDPNTNRMTMKMGIPSVEVTQGRNREESTTKVYSTQGTVL